MGPNVTRYRSFLLRIWHAGSLRHPQWRASLEDTRTRKIAGFTSLEALLAFLRQLEAADTMQGGVPPAGLPDDTSPTQEPTDPPNRISKEEQ